MNTIRLPALRADQIVGFLAALGVLRLTTDVLDDPAKLSWPDGGRDGAVLRSRRFADLGELSTALYGVAHDLRTTGRLVPGVDGLPLVRSDADPMNSLSFDDGRGLATSYQLDPVGSEWLASMVGLASPGEDGRLKRSRWWAVGPGPVTIAGTLTKALEPIVGVADIASALTSWRRHDWVGGYLDNAADVGKERIAGTRKRDEFKAAVVGGTWLALLATGWFPERAIGETATETVGWGVSGRRAVFGYPVWREALDASAVRVMLDHPAVSRRDGFALRGMSVAELWECVRLRSGNNNVSVTHPHQVWPAG